MEKIQASNVTLSRDERIKKEKRRLNGIFRDLDANKKKTVKSLIDNAAFMAIALEDLQEIISRDGYTEEYQNGQNQKGMKETAEVKTHMAMTKNHAMVIKLLADLTPPARRKKSRLQALRDDDGE
ncbi:MAG: hypothetical protein GX418_12120 [Clostridiales bacterium]|nr:hypothetical protein [Clostridiales bacterium]